MRSGKRGLCPACRKMISLRKDGLLQGHGKTGHSCPGSWRKPSTGQTCAPGLGWPLDGLGSLV